MIGGRNVLKNFFLPKKFAANGGNDTSGRRNYFCQQEIKSHLEAQMIS